MSTLLPALADKSLSANILSECEYCTIVPWLAVSTLVCSQTCRIALTVCWEVVSKGILNSMTQKMYFYAFHKQKSPCSHRLLILHWRQSSICTWYSQRPGSFDARQSKHYDHICLIAYRIQGLMKYTFFFLNQALSPLRGTSICLSCDHTYTNAASSCSPMWLKIFKIWNKFNAELLST